MKEIKIDAYAKINLSLDVLRRKEDGYHELRMIMQQINLKDILTIKEIEEETFITSNSEKVPLDSSNLVYKAWKLIGEAFNINKNVHIHIEKNIPIAAGLAGGSSDAAAVLKGLSILWDLKLDENKLKDLGLKLGADVPYCIVGGTALAEGIGEKLTVLKNFSNKLILIAKPDIDVSTQFVYKNLDLKNINNHPETDKLIDSIEKNDLLYLSNNMINVLETVTIKKYDIIEKIKNAMIKYGALGSLMSGSGPTVFGIFETLEDISSCKNELDKYLKEVYVTETI